MESLNDKYEAFKAVVIEKCPDLVLSSWSLKFFPRCGARIPEDMDRKYLSYSKLFGMHPYRFRDFKWPRCDCNRGFMRLLCQLRVGDLPPQLQKLLPEKAALLQAFICGDCRKDQSLVIVEREQVIPSLQELARWAIVDNGVDLARLPSKIQAWVEEKLSEKAGVLDNMMEKWHIDCPPRCSCFCSKLIGGLGEERSKIPSFSRFSDDVSLLNENASMLRRVGITGEEFSALTEDLNFTCASCEDLGGSRLGGWPNYPFARFHPRNPRCSCRCCGKEMMLLLQVDEEDPFFEDCIWVICICPVCQRLELFVEEKPL